VPKIHRLTELVQALSVVLLQCISVNAINLLKVSINDNLKLLLIIVDISFEIQISGFEGDFLFWIDVTHTHNLKKIPFISSRAASNSTSCKCNETGSLIGNKF